MEKVLVLFLGMVMSASMMWADNAPRKWKKSTEDKPQTVYVEVYLNDLSGEYSRPAGAGRCSARNRLL